MRNASETVFDLSLIHIFYFKEQEMQKIITTIEGIRYGMDESTILSMVIKH